MNHPWMKFYSRDWLDDQELRLCSLSARAVLIDLIALAHEGTPYGVLATKQRLHTASYIAYRCMVSLEQFSSALEELLKYERIHISECGALYVKRMVRDEEIRLRRAAGGIKGGNPALVNHKDNLKGYLQGLPPSDSVSVVNKESSLRGIIVRPGEIARMEKVVSSVGFDAWWPRWCVLTGRAQRKTDALRAWIGMVEEDQAHLVMNCLERYGRSEEVSRKIITNPDKWLYDQGRDGWSGDWPMSRESEDRMRSEKPRLPDPPGALEIFRREQQQRIANGEEC